MIENQNLVEQLKQLLPKKQSKKFYAQILNVSEETINNLLQDIRKNKVTEFFDEFKKEGIKFLEDVSKGTGEIIFDTSNQIKSLDELIEKCDIDINKWEITKYIQNYWGNESNPRWQVKAWLSLKKEEGLFQENFLDFLKTYKSDYKKIEKEETLIDYTKKVSLILPKQDSHLNKFDIKGDNDIQKRFITIEKSVLDMVKKASGGRVIEEIVYIVGSDQFNSEWTSQTTKGTPQQNILSYQESFKLICNHEITIIKNLISYAENVKIIYIPGNHDEYVGWHLINFLESYFANEEDIEFDSLVDNTKYHKYGNSAIMLNHGDAIKPKDLAHKFPIGFKKEWSSCDNYYIFTGDKHHELSLDIHGIKFYQIPQLSKAKSKWDDKQGYTDSKAEATAFVITKDNGMSDIYKDIL